MTGRVIQVIRSCPQLAWLTEADRQALARCGRPRTYAPGQVILQPQDTSLCILTHGRVKLDLAIAQQGERCRGQAVFELSTLGTAFGWGSWVHPERIAVSAMALGSVSVLRFELGCQACDTGFNNLGICMIHYLYKLLQESGLCPPNLQTYLRLFQAKETINYE